MKKLYVGNLPYSVGDDELRTIFEAYGTVESAVVIMDKMSNRSKGFGFVEMDDAGADAALAAEVVAQDRTLKVDEARPRAE